AWLRPGTLLTRRTAAAGLILFSGLLLHLSSGRPEVAFHIFCGVAALTFYMEPSLLLFAAALATADGALTGLIWPGPAGSWRWIEQGAWGFVEALILGQFIRQNLAARRQLAEYG